MILYVIIIIIRLSLEIVLLSIFHSGGGDNNWEVVKIKILLYTIP